jgi:hypothetical protein
MTIGRVRIREEALSVKEARIVLVSGEPEE